MTLDDICQEEPDWEKVLVFSDYMEENGDQKTAEAIRWLYVWDHWPYKLYCAEESKEGFTFVWFFEGTILKLACSRYKDSSHNARSAVEYLWERASLPRIFLKPEDRLDCEEYPVDNRVKASSIKELLELFISRFNTLSEQQKIMKFRRNFKPYDCGLYDTSVPRAIECCGVTRKR